MPDKQAIKRITRNSVRRLVEVAAGLLVVVGVLLHLTIRDHVWPISAAYYGLPAGVVVLLAAAAMLTAPRSRKSTWAMMLIGVSSWWYVTAVATGDLTRQKPDDAIRVMSWNMFYGLWGYDRCTAVMRDYEPDVIALVEGGPRSPEWRAKWADALPGYEGTYLGDAFIVLSKFPVIERATPPIPGNRFRHVTVQAPDGPFDLVLCHPVSSPVFDRGPTFELLTDFVTELRAGGTRRVLLCGDFNTPTGSVHLDGLREQFRLTHEQPGGPFRPTWPSVLPVLTLDQVWISDGFELVGDGCQHPWTTASDHKPVVVDLRLNALSGAPRLSSR